MRCLYQLIEYAFIHAIFMRVGYLFHHYKKLLALQYNITQKSVLMQPP